MQTAEERLLADIQAAFEYYRDILHATGGGSNRRNDRVMKSIGGLVAEVSEVNWLVRNGWEW